MECRLPQPTGIVVTRDRNNAAVPQTFEEAFSHQKGEWLAPAGQAALLAFAQHVYPWRLREGTLRITMRGRTLRLSDRERLGELFGPEVLPDATVVLLHDFPYLGLTVDELTTLLNDMSVVCGEIEG